MVIFLNDDLFSASSNVLPYCPWSGKFCTKSGSRMSMKIDFYRWQQLSWNKNSVIYRLSMKNALSSISLLDLDCSLWPQGVVEFLLHKDYFRLVVSGAGYGPRTKNVASSKKWMDYAPRRRTIELVVFLKLRSALQCWTVQSEVVMLRMNLSKYWLSSRWNVPINEN